MPQYSLVGVSSHSDIEIHHTFRAASENDVWRYIVTHWGDAEIVAGVPTRYTLNLGVHDLTIASLKAHIERNNDRSYTLKLICNPVPIKVTKSKIEKPSETTAKMIKEELDMLANEKAEAARIDALPVPEPRYHRWYILVPDLQAIDSEWLRNHKIRRILKDGDYCTAYRAPNIAVVYSQAADGVYDSAYINKLVNAGEPRVITK